MSGVLNISENVNQASEESPSENLMKEAPPPEIQMKDAEKNEEAKLRAKYPHVNRPGGSVFLQKRLQKGQKYFDSGDYNMAKAKGQKARVPPIVNQIPTGDAIPTPEDLPARKTSIVQSKLASELS